MSNQHKPTSFLFAACVILMAIFLYDVMGAIVKHLGRSYSAEQLSVFRNFFGMFPSLILLLLSKDWIDAGRPIVIRQWKLAIGRGLISAVAQLMFYISLQHLAFATATSVLYAGPLIVTALSIPVLGHKVGIWRWVAVFIGFAGVVWIIRPATDSFNWYAVLPLLAATGYASISVLSKLFSKDVPTPLITLYQNIGALIGAIVLLMFAGGFTAIATTEDWLWLIAMGCAGGSAAYLLVSAYRLADPSSLSPFEYFGIIFSFSLGWIFFSEAPFDQLIPGVFLIIGGGLVIAWRERINH